MTNQPTLPEPTDDTTYLLGLIEALTKRVEALELSAVARSGRRPRAYEDEMGQKILGLFREHPSTWFNGATVAVNLGFSTSTEKSQMHHRLASLAQHGVLHRQGGHAGSNSLYRLAAEGEEA